MGNNGIRAKRRAEIIDYLSTYGPLETAVIVEEMTTTSGMLRVMVEEGHLTRYKEGRSYLWAVPASTNGNGQTAERTPTWATSKPATPKPTAKSFKQQVDQQRRIAQAAEDLFGSNPRDWASILAWYEMTKELMDRG